MRDALAPWTHNELVARAGLWLRSSLGCTAVLLEPGYGTPLERPDAIGWRAGVSTLVECKVSRADFLRDRNKPSRRREGTVAGFPSNAWGGALGAHRWYLTPKGLLSPDEIPDGWGLAEVRGTRVYKVLTPTQTYPRTNRTLLAEVRLLSAAIAASQHVENGWFPPTSKHATYNLGQRVPL